MLSAWGEGTGMDWGGNDEAEGDEGTGVEGCEGDSGRTGEGVVSEDCERLEGKGVEDEGWVGACSEVGSESSGCEREGEGIEDTGGLGVACCEVGSGDDAT